MTKRVISDAEAAEKFGVQSYHEQMANGEVRFRLNSNDGSSYIRTESVQSSFAGESGWQNGHFHKQAVETYVVQSGTMILVSKTPDGTEYKILKSGDVVSTEPLVPHNVYLSPGSKIHTVKHGGDGQPDWHPFPELDEETKSLTEVEAMNKAVNNGRTAEIDARYASYVSIYNNFDGIIWRMPAFLVAGITLIIGISVGIFSKEDARLPAEVWGGVFFVSFLILFLGTYSLYRLRLHHNMMGEELERLEPDGYFHRRANTIGSFPTPGAPILFIAIFLVAALLFAFASYLVFTGNPTILDLLNISAVPEGATAESGG